MSALQYQASKLSAWQMYLTNDVCFIRINPLDSTLLTVINSALLLAAADSQSDLRMVITGSEDDQDLLITSEGKSKATETRNIPYGSSYKHSGAASLLSVDYETHQHLSAEEISLHYSSVATSLTSPQVCYVYECYSICHLTCAKCTHVRRGGQQSNYGNNT